ncbi:MAG: CoA-acylating methylmalonate-semialdehyde dehydrogenase [Verrucomicrobia bacterium]|nr:CoA-acylating methylmalonate-semialdehyde dehydrogenase [Verrucomicrobiota bacterium]
MSLATLPNYCGGAWRPSQATQSLEVFNPATGEAIARVPLSPAAEVDQAVGAAAAAFPDWRRTPAADRIQCLFNLKRLMEEQIENLARSVTVECGKTLAEARAEIRRAIENVEVASGAPILLQGDFSEDIAAGIDELTIRQPLGVCACICPFNFPGMIPFWFMPYALACGNTYIVKPSERVPLTMQRLIELIAQAGFPKGVVNLVNGAKETVDALLDHPGIRAISFVGSTAVARYVYARAAAQGKRAQCQGGAKNPIVVLPDAEPEMTTRITADSAFGCAGQRCLAASLAVTVGEARRWFTEAIADAAASRVVGNGLEESVQMGPVISAQSMARIEQLVERGVQQGARPIVDGRRPTIRGCERGFFVRPTVLDDLAPEQELTGTEIFGPVLGLAHVATLDDAIAFANRGPYGNMACLFTSSGASARKFRCEVEAGNIGINIGVAAPMAYFPFSGAKESFFGDLHGQARHAFEFFTQTKVVIERWPREWSREF